MLSSGLISPSSAKKTNRGCSRRLSRVPSTHVERLRSRAVNRTSVLSALLFQDYNHWQHLSVWLQSVAVLLSVALSAGYQTPVIAVLDILFHGLIWIRLGVGSVAEVTIVSLDAIALALLGPGAYSVDAYRFGRRVLVLPPP